MAFCIPSLADDYLATPPLPPRLCSSSETTEVLRRRCARYRRVVRKFRQQIARRALSQVAEVIETHEATVRATLDDFLVGLVLEGATQIVERMGSGFPDLMAEGLAREAERFATTVLRGEREVVVRAHPEDRAIIANRCGGLIGWRWEDNPRQPRGEISLNLTSGVITIRWRNLVGGFAEASVVSSASQQRG